MDDNALHELTAGYALDALDPAEDAVVRGAPRALRAVPGRARRTVRRRRRARLRRHACRAAAPRCASGSSRPRAPSARTSSASTRRAASAAGAPPFASLAVAASVAAIGLGVWNIALHQQLNDSRGAAKRPPARSRRLGRARRERAGDDDAGEPRDRAGREDLRGLGDRERQGEARRNLRGRGHDGRRPPATARCPPARSSRSRSSATAGRRSRPRRP